MMRNINEILNNLDNMPITQQYEIMSQMSDEIQSELMHNRDQNNIQKAKLVRDQIHDLRFKMAYNKATEIGDFDNNLKKAWQSLNDLIGSD